MSVFINLANYAAGIAVALILILKKDFISIFYLNGMTSNECLFFNLLIFQAVLALTGVTLVLLLGEYKKSEKDTVFSLIYEVLPVAVSAVCIYFAFAGETVREKVVVILISIVYSLLSAVIIYTGSKAFNLYEKKDS